MNDSITNTVEVSGLFNGLTTGLTATAVTAMTDELLITKSANKQVWAGGILVYNIELENLSTTLTYEGVTFNDVIDPTRAVLVNESVKLNGADVTYQYDEVTGALTLTIGDIAPTETATITFEVTKA